MSKIQALSDAIEEHIEREHTIAIEGFTHLIPFAAAHEIIRQRIKGLTLSRLTPDILTDQLVGADCVSKLIFGFAGSAVGSLYAIRRALEGKDERLATEEMSHHSLICRYKASAAGLPFYPLKTSTNSDWAQDSSEIAEVTSPFDENRQVDVVSPLTPDVAIIHAHRADSLGNVQAWGVVGPLTEVAFASRKVIVTVEEIVSPEIIASDPNRTIIPSFIVDSVVQVPYGAHPSFVQGKYNRDNTFYREWSTISKSPEKLSEWIDNNVHRLTDHAEYVKRNKIAQSAINEVGDHFSAPVNYGS